MPAANKDVHVQVVSENAEIAALNQNEFYNNLQICSIDYESNLKIFQRNK